MAAVSRLDEMLQRAFEEDQREQAKREAQVEAQRDPFKQPHEPSRAAPRNRRRAVTTSLGGEHS